VAIHGVYINTILRHSLADKAGIKEGDMLYSINDYTIDQYGDMNAIWGGSGKVSVEEFLSRCPVGSQLRIKIYRNGIQKEFDITLTEPHLYRIRPIYASYEHNEVDYELVGGMCVMQLRINHFDVLPKTVELRKYSMVDYMDDDVLVVTSVLPGSLAHKTDCLSSGSLLESVNGESVSTLDQLRKALKKSKETGLVSIKTKDSVSTVLSFDKMKKDEPRLARDFMFTITPSTKELFGL
jgi:C-terminal processing protease CtpA/Prc